MPNINVIEILQVGLPGLVFLLSLLSYHLLTKEQGRAAPNFLMLKSIGHYGYLNLVLALLTAVPPIVDMYRIKSPSLDNMYTVSARSNGAKLEKGNAAVCVETAYANRHLLIKDEKTQMMIQVYSRSVIPCAKDDIQISLTPEDAANLGWETGKTASKVELVPAAPGQMFVM